MLTLSAQPPATTTGRIAGLFAGVARFDCYRLCSLSIYSWSTAVALAYIDAAMFDGSVGEFHSAGTHQLALYRSSLGLVPGLQYDGFGQGGVVAAIAVVVLYALIWIDSDAGDA